MKDLRTVNCQGHARANAKHSNEMRHAMHLLEKQLELRTPQNVALDACYVSEHVLGRDCSIRPAACPDSLAHCMRFQHCFRQRFKNSHPQASISAFPRAFAKT